MMTGKIYGMTAEQADLAMGMLMKTIQEQQKQIDLAEKLAHSRWKVIDMKDRIK